MDAEELKQAYGYEYPAYPRSDWVYEQDMELEGDKLPYWNWVAAKLNEDMEEGK